MKIYPMDDDLTLEQFIDIARNAPISGETTRLEFEAYQQGGLRIVHEGCVIIAGHNYRCMDAYSPQQRVQLLGVSLSVYTDHHCCAQGSTTNPDDIPALFEKLAAEARKQCEHTYGRELSIEECRKKKIGHYGNCWHVYECGKCGEFFGVDSSD